MRSKTKNVLIAIIAAPTVVALVLTSWLFREDMRASRGRRWD